MTSAIELAERRLLPDRLIRYGIRRLLRHRLRNDASQYCDVRSHRCREFIADMRISPVAVYTDRANEQHYELPPAFFELVLGRHLKYSCCYYKGGANNLDEAEDAMLELTARRAEITDGMKVLDLGCGWGSKSLWLATRFPNCHITAVSNSHHQREFIENQCRHRGIGNVMVTTADMNEFDTTEQYDRVVSIEMFEHLRNYATALERIDRWLQSNGKAFIHVFCHRDSPYLYEDRSTGDWMGKHFFTGGMMPSDNLLLYFQDHLVLENHWRVGGENYARTAEDWLRNLDENRDKILPILREAYGDEDRRWFQRWRMFFLSCAELFGYNGGEEWWVAHYRFGKRR